MANQKFERWFDQSSTNILQSASDSLAECDGQADEQSLGGYLKDDDDCRDFESSDHNDGSSDADDKQRNTDAHDVNALHEAGEKCESKCMTK